MRASLVLAAVLTLAGTGAAPAQTAPAAPGTAPHGMNHDGPGAVGQPLEAGASSFTEDQVKERFGKMGFSEIRDLAKDDRGIWRGKANHAGKEVGIGMDFKGNVAAQ